MKDVFISYSSKDKTIADAVCARLEAQGIRCWIAPRDVLPSDLYGEAIIRAIHGSRVMVLVFSANSNGSPQVVREVERGVSQGLAILPFRIEDVPMSPNMEYFISAPHWLDAMTDPLDEHLERLAATVKVILSQSEAKPETPTSQTTVPEATIPKAVRMEANVPEANTPAPIIPTPTTPQPPAPQPPTPEMSAPPIIMGPSVPGSGPLQARKNSLPLMLIGGALLLLVAGGLWNLSRGRPSTQNEQGASERTSAVPPSAPSSPEATQQEVSGSSSQEEVARNSASEASVAANSASQATADAASPGQKLTGRVGDELTDGRWRFQLLDVQPVKSYTMQKTTETDYALYRATADLADNIFRAKSGYQLFVVHGRVINAWKEKQTFWHYNTNTALLDTQDESSPPIAFDMRGGQIQSDPLLPGSKLDFAMVFALSEGRQPKELVFTLRTISETPTTDVHVQLK